MLNYLRKSTAQNSTKRWVRKTSWLTFAVALLLSPAARAQMSGTYTVCSSGCNYSTIKAAVSALQSNGVNGATTIQIKKGDYNESVSISGISGVSATNTLTFVGMGTVPGEVKVHNSSTYVIELNNIKYVTLQNMQIKRDNDNAYSAALSMQYASFCKIKGCELLTPVVYDDTHWNLNPLYSIYSTDNLIESCIIRGGHDAINEGDFNYGNERNKYSKNRITQFAYDGITGTYTNGNEYYDNYMDSGTYTYASGIYCEGEQNVKYHRNTVVGYSMYYAVFLYFDGGVNEFINNSVVAISGTYYGLYINPYTGSQTIKIYQNTVHMEMGTYGVYIINSAQAPIDFRNNNLTSSGNAIPYYQSGKSGFNAKDIIDGNNYYRSTSGTLIYYNSTAYSTLAAYKTAAATFGHGINDLNMAVTYKSSTDVHVDQTKVVPAAKSVGVYVDIDGDARCKSITTVGSDESTYTGNPHYSKPSKPKFTGPSTAYVGNPTVYFNSGKATDPVNYSWYVNGKWITDSLHLKTTALTGPTSKVKLVASTCGGKDSMEMTVTVSNPPTKPTSDFISNYNTIKQGGVVTLQDLSTGYPAAWKWEISPKTAVWNGSSQTTYMYTYGDTFSPEVMIRFMIPGKYKVCMTASNITGTGNTECKVDYIEVEPSINIGQVQVVKNPSGNLYDDGGPTRGNTAYGKKQILIDPCASDVYFVFNYFDMMCGYNFVRIYDGDKEVKGKELHPCTTSNGNSATGGLTGGNGYPYCYGSSCKPETTDKPLPDTFHAKSGKMLIVQDIYYPYYEPYSPGFEGHWWSVPTTEPAPTAKFSSVDSICTNGFINFKNESQGTNMSFLWDLDGDGEFDPVSGNDAIYPYFFPGNVTITLVAQNCGGSDTFQKTIKIFNPNSPTVQFSADNTNPTLDDIVFMKSDIVECVDEYKWTFTHLWGTGVAQFMNGTKNTSQNPQVKFTDTGCYSVELYAKNVTGDDQFKLNCYIRVRGTYCQPSTMNMSQDIGISYVEFNSIKSSSTQGVSSYTNFVSDPTRSTIAEIGATYALTVGRNTNKNKATRTVWIDWNQNSNFENNEKVAEETNALTLSWTKDITIPATAKIGATVMRIAITQGSQTNDPCGPLTYGEYEDYRLYVRSDLTKPVITMLGDDTVYVEQGYTYTDAGATAVDNLDGDITSLIIEDSSKFSNLVPKTYIWTYSVKDAAGNWADPAKRVVIVTADKTAPELVVAGDDTILLQVFQPFTPQAVIKAFDLVDGDMKGYEVVNSNVVNTKVGWYTVNYTLTDINSNIASVTRYVHVIDTIMPTIALVGSATVQHEVGTPYADAGVTVSDNYYSNAELEANLDTSSNLDENVLGTYSYVYALQDPFTGKTVSVTRTIEVVDTKAPVLTLIGLQNETLEVFETYTDKGIKISDNYYKTLNNWDTLGTFYQNFPDGRANKLGTYTIIYRVTDPSGNSADIMREITVVDITDPEIELVGEPTANVCRWATYSDAGYDLDDNYWPNDSVTVTTEGTYDDMKTALEGMYTLRYVATDRSGNVGYSKWRIIYVQNPYEFPCSTVTSIKDAKGLDKAVKVYPNPNNGKFTVEANIPANEQVRLTVTNMVGQEVAVISNGSLQSNKFTVDLSNHAAGVYLLNITTANHTITKRIVVNK